MSDPGADGRSQLIEAAIASVQDIGYHRSSTNEIARRAGVSWGTVQYHFGSRQALFLAVVADLNRRFVEDLAGARLDGATVEERVCSLYRLLSPHYDDPAFLVRLQLVWDLQRDPATSDEIMATLAHDREETEATIRRLLRDVLGPTADAVAVETLFHAVRGFALSRQLSSAVNQGFPPPARAADEVFLRGVAVAVSEAPGATGGRDGTVAALLGSPPAPDPLTGSGT